MNRSMLLLALSFCLTGITPAQNASRPLVPTVKYTAAQLQGFDLKAATKKAQQVSAKFAEQQEYLDFLVRQHVAAKQHAGHNHPEVQEKTKSNSAVNNSNCANAGFEYIDFTNWNGYTYTNTAATNWATFTPAWVAGISTDGVNTPMQPLVPNIFPTTARHTIMTQAPGVNNPPFNCVGYDSIAINPVTHLSDIPFLSAYANGVVCRLGNAAAYAETERLSYPISVTPQNCMFRYSYAFVYYQSVHAPGEAAFFSVNVKDLAGNVLSNCGNFYIDELGADSTIIQASSWAPGGVWQDPPNTFNFYKKWTQQTLDLSAYVGQTVIIDFINADCVYGGHWGYTYIDLECSVGQAATNWCGGTGPALLTVPSGFASYQWYGPNSSTPVAGATNDSLTISSPVAGDVYTIQATAASGCTTTYTCTVNPTSVNIQSIFSTLTCAGGNTGTATVIPSGAGSYNYSWIQVPSGTPVGSNSSSISGLAPGTYSVDVSAAGCGQASQTVTVGAAPPSYSTQTVSECSATTTLHAAAGTNYQWYDSSGEINGATLDSITVPAYSGAEYFVSYLNPGGCTDSVKYSIVKTVTISNQTVDICGSPVVLNAPAGANTITWYDANWPYSVIGNGSSITLNNPVTGPWAPYYLSYSDTSGCKDSVLTYLQQNNVYISSSVQNPCTGNSTPGSATLYVFNGFAPTNSFTITGPGSYSNSTITSADTLQLSGLAAGTYTVVLSNNGTCTVTDSFTLSSNTSSYISNSTNVICNSDSAVLQFMPSAIPLTVCQPTALSCSAPAIQQVGTGTLNNASSTWPTTYGNWYSNEKYQILYSAADLQAAGLSAGKISSIGFDVSSIPAGTNTQFINYTIKISCTNTQSLTAGSSFVSEPFFTAFGPQTINVTSTGWQSHQFSQPYVWDGTSNLIVDICYDWVAQNTYTYNIITKQTATSYASFLVYNSDTQPSCGQSVYSSSYSQRPNTRFGICAGTTSSNFTYSWSPSVGLSSDSTQSTVATPTVTTNYTVTATPNGGGCPQVDSITVYVNQIPQPVITQNGDTLVASIGSGYQWLLNGVPISGAVAQSYLPSQNGNYAVIVTYNSCGEDTSAAFAYMILNIAGSDIENKNIVVFPNPASDHFMLYTRHSEKLNYELYNITGDVVLSGQLEKNKFAIIPTGHLANGMYFLYVRNETLTEVKKLIIKR